MALEQDKRRKKRIVPEDTFTVYCQGEPCRLVDISRTGLGISYLGGEGWPEKIELDVSLDRGSGRKRVLKCLTVWESRMDFYRTRGTDAVRRRGLKFADPASEAVDELNRYFLELQREQ